LIWIQTLGNGHLTPFPETDRDFLFNTKQKHQGFIKQNKQNYISPTPDIIRNAPIFIKSHNETKSIKLCIECGIQSDTKCNICNAFFCSNECFTKEHLKICKK
jgi:hypothetical protein